MEYIYRLATPLLFFLGVPQTIKLYKTKKANDISMLTYMMTLCGVFLLFLESLNSGKLSLILGNGCSVIMLSVNLILILFYVRRSKKSKTNGGL